MDIQVYQDPPPHFKSTLDVAGVFCEWKDLFLLLHRSPGTLQENTWGLPAGKVENGEELDAAAVREVQEEAGLQLDKKLLIPLKPLYVKHSGCSYLFHTYRYTLKGEKPPEVALAPREHQDFRWLTISKARTFPLIAGGPDILDLRESFSAKS
jgi:8-oxo-dGTP pyrophosphatase MutT (NUDIX family)